MDIGVSGGVSGDVPGGVPAGVQAGFPVGVPGGAAGAAAGFLARYAGLHGRLPGGPATRGARDAAAEAFRKSGLPDRRVEAWKYTNLRALGEAGLQEPLTPVDPQIGDLPALDAPRLVFLDGRYQPNLSALPEGVPGVEVTTFGEQAVFGPLAQPGKQPLAALNTMLAEDGAVVTVAAGQDAGTILLVSDGDGAARPAAFHPRHRIRLGAGAKLTLVEVSQGRGTYLHNPVLEAELAEGATLAHVRLLRDPAGAFHLATVYADVAARGTYDGFYLNLGGRLVRNEVHARLRGPNGTAHLNGAQLLGGTQHGDFTTVVSHDAPHCASRQTVKTVASGRGRGVFQGRIEVARPAQKTDGYQMSQALLLSSEAEVDFKPELEIYADDVKCSHGATVGELDADQLFYLRSRGVPEGEARALLIRAFLAEALDAVPHEGARALLEDAIEAWWHAQPDGTEIAAAGSRG